MTQRKKYCASHRIKRLIIQRICDGIYVPGQRLVELQIAKEFNISQAPIREAFSELGAMRIVETQPYKGTRVRTISNEELRDCLEVRGVIEQLATTKFGQLKEDKLQFLKQKAIETFQAAKKHDFKAYGIANFEFHRSIIESTNNHTLMMVWDILAPEVRMLSSIRASSDDCLEQGADDHMEIVDALADGDNRAAGILLRKHGEKVLIADRLTPAMS